MDDSVSASSVSVSNTLGQLSCSICKRKISEMILTTCFHSFCPQCLHGNASRSARTGQYECPICKTPITLPANSKIHTDLRKMTRERNMDTERRREWMDHKGPTRASRSSGRHSMNRHSRGSGGYPINQYCDICGDHKLATNHCLVCKEAFCDSCTNAHLKMKVSRYHGDQVVPIEDEDYNNYSKSTPEVENSEPMEKYCPRHMTQEILFVCKQCNVMVCNICKLMEHENHVTKLVSEEANNVREELQDLLDNENDHLDTIQSKLQTLEEKQRKYPTVLEYELEKVRQHATKIHIDIDKEKTDKERELESHYNMYIDRANMSRESLSKDLEQRAALVRQAEMFLDTDDDIRILKDGNTLCKKLQTDQNGEYHNLDNDDQPIKRFVPTSIDPKSQALVGVVADSNNLNDYPIEYSRMDLTASPRKKSPLKPAVQTMPSPTKPKTDPTQYRSVKSQTSYASPPAGKISSTPKQSPKVRTASPQKPAQPYIPPISPISYVATPPTVNNMDRKQAQVRSPAHSQHSQRSDSPPFIPPTDIKLEPIKLSSISSFTIPNDDLNGYIYGIAPIAGQEMAWVSMLDHNKIVLVDKDGQIKNAVNLGEPCEGITSDTNGGCYVTCPRTKTIYYVKNTGQVQSVVTNLAMHPHGMAGWQFHDNRRKTMIEELFVCFTDSRKTAFYEKAKGSIGVFSFFGQDLGKSFSLGSPVRIDVDLTTKMLCIADHMNGCVLICDKTGQYTTALYTGEEKEDELFKPLGVCFDDTSHVIVADWAGSKVSRISLDGRLVQHLLTDLNGPQSVAMGDNGMLWVGAKKGKIFVYKIN